MRVGYRAILGAVAAAVVGAACADNTPVYLGGPPGAAAAIDLSSSAVDLIVGSSRAVGGAVRDATGNVTGDAVSFTSCDGSVVSVATAAGSDPWTAEATLTGAGLGVSCVVATGGGFTDTIRVRTGPVGMKVTGPDTVGSGNAAVFAVAAVDAAGSALSGTTEYEWTSGNTARIVLTKATGDAAGRAIGSVAVNVRAPGGGDATKTVVVAPGVFGGTLSATSAAPGALITVNRATDGPKFDSDVTATLGSTAAYVDEITPDAMIFAAPATNSTATAKLLLSNMGLAQIAQTVDFTATKTNADVYSPGNTTNDCSDPATPINYATAKSPLGWVYMVHTGSAQGATGCQNGGAGYDHYVLYTTGAAAETVNITAEWRLSGDIDVYVCTTTYSACPGIGVSSATTNEILNNVALAANTSYWVIWSPWTANSGVNNARLRIVKQ